MKVLSNSEVTLMESLVKVSQDTLRDVLYKFLKQHYKNVIYDKDYLIAEGDIPIALVAHMDTVFKTPATELFYDRRKNVMWSPQGMGADDRAGVYAIIQIIKAGYHPHIIFTTDEEKGCIGASTLASTPCPFKDLRYFIQLDRRGANDCVFYDCDNENFEKYVETFGFVTAWGSFTDICELCPAWGAAGVNLSIGYRDEHSISEILFVGQMLDTIEKVKQMLSVKNPPKFKYIPMAYTSSLYYDDYDYYYNYGFKSFYPTKNTRYRCHNCKLSFPGDEVIDVKLIKGGKGFYCVDCLMEGTVEWCTECGEAFEIDPKVPKETKCKDCRKKGSKGKKDKCVEILTKQN